jgi:hypothetical protein
LSVRQELLARELKKLGVHKAHAQAAADGAADEQVAGRGAAHPKADGPARAGHGD